MSISNPYLSSALTQELREYLAEEAQNKDLELLSEENILFVDKGVTVAVTENSAGYSIRSIQAGFPKDNLLSVILREVQKSKIKAVVCFEGFLDPSEYADDASLKLEKTKFFYDLEEMIEEADLGFSTNLYLIDPSRYVRPASEVSPEEYFYEDLKSASIAKLPDVYRTLTTIAQLLDSADRGTGADQKPNSSGFSEEAQADPLTRFFKLDNAGYFRQEEEAHEDSRNLADDLDLRDCADILIDHMLDDSQAPSDSEEIKEIVFKLYDMGVPKFDVAAMIGAQLVNRGIVTHISEDLGECLQELATGSGGHKPLHNQSPFFKAVPSFE